MSRDSDLVSRHLAALEREANEAGIPTDVLARLILQEAVAIWQRERSWQDIASELQFVAENLDPEMDHEFMRP